MAEHDWRPLSSGLATKTTVKFDTSGVTLIKTEGDEAPVLDYAHALRDLSAQDGGFVPGTDRSMKRVATLPAALIVKWLTEEGIDVYNPEHADRVVRKLNDPDYAYLRTAPGQLALVGDDETFR